MAIYQEMGASYQIRADYSTLQKLVKLCRDVSPNVPTNISFEKSIPYLFHELATICVNLVSLCGCSSTSLIFVKNLDKYQSGNCQFLCSSQKVMSSQQPIC